MRSSGPTDHHSISVLSWLVQHNYLCELTLLWTQWSEAYRRPSHEYDIDAMLDDDSDSFGTVAIDSRVFGVEALADFLSQAHASIFSDSLDGELEPLWLAEVIQAWTPQDQAAFTTDQGDVLLAHWKFDRSMRSDIAPMLAFYAHLRSPQLEPACFTYEALLADIDRSLNLDRPAPLLQLVERLSATGTHISVPLLLSLLRNEPRYLLVYKANSPWIVRAESWLVAWNLACDVLDPSEYVRGTNMGFERCPYWEAGHTPVGPVIVRFFSFHQKNINWDELDLLEVALKLKAMSGRLDLLQGIPRSIHAFIVNWIVKNGAVWRSRDAPRTLGSKFDVDPSHVSPGRLLVYGTPESIRAGGTSLVVREMVSESVQTRGQIHPSRVQTPFHDVELKIEKDEIKRHMAAQESFKILGVAHLSDVAEAMLARRGVKRFPYFLRRAQQDCIAALPDDVAHLGSLLYRGLLRDSLGEKNGQATRLLDSARRLLAESPALLDGLPMHLSLAIGRPSGRRRRN